MIYIWLITFKYFRVKVPCILEEKVSEEANI